MTRIGWMGLLGVVAACTVAGVALAKQPSFDCHEAKQWSEIMVCGNPDLADLDVRVDKAYKRAQKTLPPDQAAQVREVQRAWAKGREKCQQDPDPVKCLHDYYERRIKEIVQPKQ